jgi:hypothetical protein
MSLHPVVRNAMRSVTRPVIAPVDRQNNTAYQVGQAVYANGQIWECVDSGTTAGTEPTIIAPLLSPDVAIDGGFDDPSKWSAAAGWSVTGSQAVAVAATGNLLPTTYSDTVAGAGYLMGVSVVEFTSAVTCALFLFNGAGNDFSIPITGAGVYSVVGIASASTSKPYLAGNTINAKFDSISLTRVTIDGTAAWRTIG